MTAYNQEQMEALLMVREGLRLLGSPAINALRNETHGYFSFRAEVDAFFLKYFSDICTQKCFENQYSACCGREGITTFFADVVINALFAQDKEVDFLMDALKSQPSHSAKCVYLGKAGCLWRVKPIVCEMFLCKPAKRAAFDNQADAEKEWQRLKEKEKAFTWPSRPVLFEYLEDVFMENGYNSDLMYFHNSPGLLRLKAQRGDVSRFSRVEDEDPPKGASTRKG